MEIGCLGCESTAYGISRRINFRNIGSSYTSLTTITIPSLKHWNPTTWTSARLGPEHSDKIIPLESDYRANLDRIHAEWLAVLADIIRSVVGDPFAKDGTLNNEETQC